MKSVMELAEVVKQQSPESIAGHYCSLNWWGGAGSMADFCAPEPYNRLLIRLVHAFEAAGYNCERAASWIRVFEDWVNHGII